MCRFEFEKGERERQRETEGERERERQTIIYNSMLYFYLCIKAKLSPEAYPQNGKTTLAKNSTGNSSFNTLKTRLALKA